MTFKRGERVYWYEEMYSSSGPSGNLVTSCGGYKGMVAGSALVREASNRRLRLIAPDQLMNWADYMTGRRSNTKLAKILGFVQGKLNGNSFGTLSMRVEDMVHTALFRRGAMSVRDDFREDRQDLCDATYRGFHIALRAKLLTRQRREAGV